MKKIITLLYLLITINICAQNENSLGDAVKKEANQSLQAIISKTFHKAEILIDSLPNMIAKHSAKKRAKKINSTLCPDTLECKLDSIGIEILKAAKKFQIKTIAVWYFNDTIKNFGNIMADKLTISLVNIDVNNEFDIVDRQDISKIMNEQKLSHDKLIDPETAIEIGKLLGAEAIVTGSLRFKSNRAYADMKMIHTKTGKTLWANPYSIQLPIDDRNIKIIPQLSSSSEYKYPLPPGYKYNGTIPQNMVNSYMSLLVIYNQTSKPIIVFIDRKDTRTWGHESTTIINPGEKFDFTLYQGFFSIKIENQGTGVTIHSSELILHTYDNIKLEVK